MQVPVLTMAGLAVVFTTKHFIADFLLQTNWMARGKERFSGWFVPLTVHAACHAALVLGIALVVAPRLWWLALVDFTIHFWVDRGKTMVARRLDCTPSQVQFWWLLGLDQWLHALTDIGLLVAFLSL